MIRLPVLVRLTVLTVVTTINLTGAAAAPSPGDIQLPRLVKRLPPDYPFDMRKASLTGEVVVEFIVKKDGTVANVVAVKASRPEFVDAALNAVRQWTFEPGQKDGRPVNTRMQQSIAFELAIETPATLPTGPTEILELSAVTRAPEPIEQAAAYYPDDLRRHRIAGAVVVEFVVTYSGKVRIERLLEAAHPRLGEAAVRAVMAWTFRPALVGEKPANTRLQQRFLFDPANPAATPG